MLKKVGKYKVIEELGRGAMGIVYKAVDPDIGRTVAIKTIRFDVISEKSEQEEAQKRFIREARSAGNLSHPNIVTIYEVGKDEGLTYIAMEFIEGKALDEILASGREFSFEETARMIEKIGDALDYAHKKGVIHRDIKPGNILIDQEGNPHIVDFGIARVSSSTMTHTKVVMGTPFYMSPEQISGKPIDHRTDIFSLGAVLYELLTKQKPFPGENITTVIYKIMHEEPPPIRSFSMRFSDDLDQVLKKTLSKDQELRYTSCRELSTDLKHSGYAKKEAVQFEEVLRIQEKGKNRKPLLILLASMMAVVLIVLVSLLVYTSKNKGNIGGKGGGDTPDSIETFLSKAQSLRNQGRTDEAILEYQKALAHDNKDIRPCISLAEIYESKNEVDKAVEYYARCLEIDPKGLRSTEFSEKIAELEVIQAAETSGVSIPPDLEEIIISEDMDAASVKPRDTEPEEKLTKEQKEADAEKKESPPDKEEIIETEKTTETKEETKEEPGTNSSSDESLAQVLKDGIAAFNQEDYQKCIKNMEKVLELYPDNRYAKYYIGVAQNRIDEKEGKKRENEISNLLRSLKSEYNAGRYTSAVSLSRELLRLDPGNKPAEQYLFDANVRIAETEIKEIINQYVLALNKGNVMDFYSKTLTGTLYQRIRPDIKLLLDLADTFQASASEIKIKVTDVSDRVVAADVSFIHIIIGSKRSEGTRKVLFEGIYHWRMEKHSSSWKITDFNYE